MKKLFQILLCSAALTGGTFSSQAQSFAPGTNVANLGVGFGYTVKYYNDSRTTPVLSVSFEHGFQPLGPGILGLGGVVSYQGSRWEHSDVYGDHWEYEWKTLFIAARATWHPDALIGDKYDVYGALQVGYYNYGYKYKATGPYVNNYYYENPLRSRVGLGLVAGGRYYFTDNIGAFLEFGYDISYSKIGLSLKF